MRQVLAVFRNVLVAAIPVAEIVVRDERDDVAEFRV